MVLMDWRGQEGIAGFQVVAHDVQHMQNRLQSTVRPPCSSETKPQWNGSRQKIVSVSIGNWVNLAFKLLLSRNFEVKQDNG